MKNINAYNEAVMVGKNWIATPFVLNYGVDTSGYEDVYIEYDCDVGAYLNYFGMEKKDYKKRIVEFANPKHYGASFLCGDVGYAKYGAPNKQYNVVQLLFDNATLKIAGLWYNSGIIPKISDYSLIGLIKFDADLFALKVKHPILVTCDTMLFKYTMNMFEDFLFLRFDTSFGKTNQYCGVIRFDSGMNDKNHFDTFSVVQKGTMCLSDELVISCIHKMQAINKLAFYE